MAQPTQQEVMQQQLASIQQAIAAYNQNPNMFTEDEVKQLKATADALGIPFEVDFSIGRAVKKGLYELGEGATLGLLPNSLDPGALNTGESLAGFAGGLLGLAVPGFGAFKAGKGALGLASRLGAKRGLGAAGTQLTPAATRLARIRASGAQNIVAGGTIGTRGAGVAGKKIRSATAARSEAEAADRVYNAAYQTVREMPDALRFTSSGKLLQAVNSIKSKAIRKRLIKAIQGLEAASEGGLAQKAGQFAAGYPRVTQAAVGIPAFMGLQNALGEDDYVQQDLYQQ